MRLDELIADYIFPCMILVFLGCVTILAVAFTYYILKEFF